MINTNKNVTSPVGLDTIPISLRKHAIQLYAVIEGIKPAAFFHIQYQHINACLSFFASKKLIVNIIRSGGQSSFSHLNPEARQIFGNTARLKICVSSNKKNSNYLSNLSEKTQMEEVGMVLGYPECCINAVMQSDESSKGNSEELSSNFNLRYHAIRNSGTLNWQTNTFLDESQVGLYGPSSLIAHYPCNYNCAESINIARNNWKLCSSYFPEWMQQLRGYLNSPVIYFPTMNWEEKFRDDTCGMAFLNGGCRRENGKIILSNYERSVTLGLGTTPFGLLLNDVQSCLIHTNFLSFHSTEQKNLFIPINNSTSPWLLDWAAASITKLTKLPKY